MISFALPDGRLDLHARELDRWAEHLTAVYRALGVQEGAGIGIVDFGSSPVAFLASRLITAGLERGVAERLPGTVICLDASRERVALVPSILQQVQIDVLVVRSEVVPLLVAILRDSGEAIAARLPLVTVDLDARAWEQPLPSPGWRRLLVVERSLLIAPECGACRSFHLDPDRYRVDVERATVSAAGTDLHQTLPARARLVRGGCADEPGSWRILGPDAEAA